MIILQVHDYGLEFCGTKPRATIKGIFLSKALNCMIFFLYKNKNGYFTMETDTFGYIVV